MILQPGSRTPCVSGNFAQRSRVKTTGPEQDRGNEVRKRCLTARNRPTGDRGFSRKESLSNPEHQISQVKTGPTQTRSAQVIQQ